MENKEPTTEELELLKKWLMRYQASESYCQDFFDKGKENYRLYKSYKQSGEKVYKHSIFVPYSFAYTEDAAAYFMLSVMASPITYSLGPRFGAVSQELCMQLEQVVHWALTDLEAEFPLELEELIKNANLYNVGYMINNVILDDGGKFDRLYFDAPLGIDVYPEPRVKRLSRANWAIKKSWDTMDNMKKLEEDEVYKNVDQAKGGAGGEDDSASQLLKSIGMSVGPDYYDKDHERCEILDCMFDGHVITIGGRRAIIQDTSKGTVRPFYFKFPMMDCRFEGAPGEFFGVGKIESIKPTQKEMNLLRSQRRDNVSLLLNKLFFYDMLAGEIDMRTLFSAPGNVIMGTNRAALDELQITDVTQSSFEESNELKFDMQNITSMWDYSFLMDFEILTTEGWKKFDDVTLQDKVMTLNTETGEIEYHKPHNKYTSPELDFDVYKIKTAHLEGEFTRRHRFPVIGRGKRNGKNRTGPKTRKFVGLDELAIWPSYRVPITGNWNCMDVEYHKIEQMYGKEDATKKQRLYTEKKIHMKDWVAFLGIFLAEGHASYRVSEGYEVGISQFNKDKKAEIRKLLEKLPFKFSETKDGFRLYDKQLCLELIDFGKAHDKYIPDDIKQLPPNKLWILYDWMMKGDGSTWKNGNGKTSEYYTISKRLADDFQEVLIKLGMNGNITQKKNGKGNLYRIVIKKGKYAGLQNFAYAGIKRGKAKCIEVQNETFMARVNGKAFWTGNSRGGTPRRKETATGIIRLQQAAQARNEWLLRKLDFYILQPICLRTLIYIRERFDKYTWDMIVGKEESRAEEFFSMSLSDIRRGFQIMPLTESIVSIKELNINQFLMAFDRLAQFPEVNRLALIKQLLIKVGEKNIKEILPMLSKQGQNWLQEGLAQFGGPEAIMQSQPGGLNLPTEEL